MNDSPATRVRTVVAAIIGDNRRLLICQRKCSDSFPLRWEFPGGKVEPGESPIEALARELREELGIGAAIGGEVYRTSYRYGELQQELLLIFFRASIDPGAAPQNLVFESFEWTTPASLPSYDFLPADRELVALLASRAIPIE